MPVTSTTLAGVNVWQLSGTVTDTELRTAWAGLITNNRYLLGRTLYVDDTCNLSGVRGTFHVDSQNLGIILHLSRNKANTIFRNWIFIQTVGLSVGARANFVRFTNGTTITNSVTDGIDMQGGGMIYAVIGNPGGGDPRFLNEMMFGSLDGTIVTSQAYTEQEIEPVTIGSIWRGLNWQKVASFPILSGAGGLLRQVIYRSQSNTEGANLRIIRPFFNNSVCYVSTTIRRQGVPVTANLFDTFGSNGSAVIMILNNFRDESYFGASKTTIAGANWSANNRIIGGVLKKILVEPATTIRTYDSRSTTVSQKSTFSETTNDFLDGTDFTLSDAVTGRASIVCIGAIATGGSVTISRFTGQRFTLQKFGFQVQVNTPDMTFGDDDLSAFSPIVMTAQLGISRTQAQIQAATEINNFQELLEELHVLAITIQGAQSYNGFNNGNLFSFATGELTTNFTTVNVDATAASKIAYNAATNTLTIKSTTLVSNSTVTKWNNSVGTINLLNSAAIQGVYQDSTGTSTVLEISGFDAGSAVYVEDNNFVQKFYSASETGTVTVYIPPSGTGSWYYAVEKYGNQRQSDFFTFSGGIREIVVKAIPDTGLTVLNSATVGAYTALETPDKIYDYVAFLRLSVPHISYGQIVFKDGTALDLVDADMIVNQSAASVASFDFDDKILTVKSASLSSGVTYNLIKTTPPKTIEAASTEVISVNIEDANGDSSVTIQGGSGNFTLWKIPNATDEDDYATGVNLGNVGNVTYRFLSAPGFKIVIRDNTTGFRQVVPMDKGNYTRGLFFGDQVQLAQSQEVTQINTKVDVLAVNVEAIKGTGFTKDTHSLINIKNDTKKALTVPKYLALK
jgi:hypothetical protein